MVCAGKSEKGSRIHVDTKHRYRHIIALAAIMFVVVIMTTAIIAINETDNSQADSFGFCGDDLTWTYTESDHKLTIAGKGAMYDYASGTSPWNSVKTNITTLLLPSGVTTIGSYAFDGCTGLTGALIIPNSVITIGDHAFSGCTGLTSTLTIGSSVSIIGANAFSGCKFTGNLTIPNSVITIGTSAFNGCVGLNGILSLSSSLTSIGESAFNGCSSLTSTDEKPLTIPASIASIGVNAFAGCTKILDIKIITGCIGINANAFSSHTFYPHEGTTAIDSRNVDFVGYSFNGEVATDMRRDSDTVKTHSVTYNVNGGSSAAPPQDPVKEGGTFSVASNDGSKRAIHSTDGYTITKPTNRAIS